MGWAASIVSTSWTDQPSASLPGLSTILRPAETRGAFPPGAVARLRFSRLGQEVYVWGDENPKHLTKGPVWLRQTRGFGSIGNTVVAGHRDTHFRFLKDAKLGDRFIVDQALGHNTFRIYDIQIVFPTDTALLAPTVEKTVTLVTCYPFYVIGRANRRLIIRAALVP